MFHHFLIAFILFLTSACAAPWARSDGQVERVVKLGMPREVKPTDRVDLEVTVRRLPSGSSLLVRLSSGDTLGIVTPFGPVPDSGRVYGFSIPQSVRGADEVTLRLQLVDPVANRIRAPSEAEVPRLLLVVGR